MPFSLITLKNLRKIDLSFNKIDKIDFPQNAFPNLEILNLSGNELSSLPQNIVCCLKLQRLYASYNHFTFEGKIPIKILFKHIPFSQEYRQA
jgi:Leucine-rich repeat (LRR) protein